jgi:hypothetical protein
MRTVSVLSAVFKNQIGSEVVRDAVHRLYQGVLYFKNIVKFHETCLSVISFIPVRKQRRFLRRFSRGLRTSSIIIRISCYIEFQSSRNVEIRDRN